MPFDEIERTVGLFQKKLSFISFMVRCLFLLIYFLVVEDYELPKSASNFLRFPLNLQ